MYNDGLDGFFDLSAKKKTLIVPEPWMKNTTLDVIYEDRIPAVIDACIAAGVYGLDTEATGLDTRVFDGVTQDKIVGICLAPDIDHGYYIPLRHQKGRNVSWSFMVEQYRRLRASKAVAVMHGAKYDQEILEFDPGMVGQGIKNFDEIATWEDTLLLALLDDSKAKQRGLKMLAETILQRKMIELEDLFPPGSKGRNFSELDPDDPAIGWYAAADAVNTLMLYQYYKPRVFDQPPKQGAVYKIEKACLLSVRWMQRNRLRINLVRVQQLIQLGQDEAFDSLAEVYEGASEILGRDVTPAYFRHLQKHFVRGDPKQTFSDQVDASTHATKFWNQQEKLLKIRDAAGREFPERYDVMSPQQLGVLLEEMKVPGLKYTEKSNQVSTKAKDLDELLEEMGDRMPFLIKIKKFRNVQKAIGTYLVHLWEDTDRRDNTLRVQFKQDGTDTGRFSTPGEKEKVNCKRNGTTKFNLHSLPQSGKKGVPECLAKIREVLEALDDEFIVSIDFSGVELRIITNLSREPLWIAEFFRCDGCGKKFDQGDGTCTPPPPPKYCPDCGSDKIGDLHTLTGISIYGADAKNQKDWKQKRGNAKSVNFALSYGGGPSAVQRAANVDKDESYRIKDKFDNAYTTLQGWWKAQKAFVRKHHYVLTPFGRKCPLPDITNPDSKISSKAERNSTNAPVQGFSADITKLAMGAIYQECLKRGWLDKVKMLITIHDELVFAIKKDVVEEAIEVLYEIMTHHRAIQFLKYPVPLTSDVELGVNWAVPWNLFEIRANGKWPAELVPYFKEAQKTLPPCERTLIPAIIPNLVVVLDQQPDQDMAAELRLILQSCQVQGGNPIQVQLPGGVVIDTGYTALRENLRQSLPSRWTLA
jgi:DNA polymerase-1